MLKLFVFQPKIKIRTEIRLIITNFLTFIIHLADIYWVHNMHMPGTVLNAELRMQRKKFLLSGVG